MRTRNLVIALVAAATLFTVTAKAGDLSLSGTNKGGGNGRFSVGAEVALPNGDFGTNAGTGFGASLRYEMPSGDNLAFMATVGYLTFGSKTVEGYGYSYKYTSSLIPIMVGGKYYFTEQQNGFYGQLQLGLTMMSTKADVTVLGTTSSNSNSTSAFTWSPGIGYHLNNLDFSASYYAFSYSQDVTTTYFGVTSTASVSYSGSWIGIRAAYVFGAK